MPTYIVKLRDEKHQRDYYLDWSTIVDAPVSQGMTLEEYTNYYRSKYGTDSMNTEFPNRMKRVEDKGTSSMLHTSAGDVIHHNRAGPNESDLNLEGILDAYCRPETVPEKSS